MLHQPVWGVPPASSDGESIKLYVVLMELVLSTERLWSPVSQFERTNKQLKRFTGKYIWLQISTVVY